MPAVMPGPPAVVPHVVVLQPLAEPRLRLEVVERVVALVVPEVAEAKAHVERLGVADADREVEDRIEDDRQGHAREERHHQAVLVVRIVVVNAVQQEVDALDALGVDAVVGMAVYTELLAV